MTTHSLVRVRITPTGCAAAAFSDRIDRLDPYLVETIVDEALRHGTGTRLDLWVPPHEPHAAFAELYGRLLALGTRGVAVHVHCAAVPYGA